MTPEEIAQFLTNTSRGHLNTSRMRLYWVHFRDHINPDRTAFTRHMLSETGYTVSLCPICSKWEFNSHVREVNDGQILVCRACYEVHSYECGDCGYRVLESHDCDALRGGYDDEPEPEPEPDEPEPDARSRRLNAYAHNVHPYSAQAPRNFFRVAHEERQIRARIDSGKSDPTVYLGVEVEMAQKETAPDDMFDLLNEALSRDFVIFKRDSSVLGRHPMEMVSAPATLAVHQSGVWDKFFETCAPHLSSGEPHHAGMHVHMSAAPITPFTKARMIAFVNKPANNSFLTLVAGRGDTNYTRKNATVKPTSVITRKTHRENCPWHVNNKAKLSEVTFALPGNVLIRNAEGRLVLNKHRPDAIIYRSRCTCPEGHYRQDFGRYEALNFATNKPTIELRIFNGTVDKATFLKNVEFAAGLVDFCRTILPFGSMTAPEFCKFIQENRKLYPALAAFLVERELIAAPRQRGAVA